MMVRGKAGGPRIRTGGRIAAIALWGVLVTVTAGGASAEDVWLTVLKAQLVKEKGCQFSHVVQSRAVQLAGAKLYEGRVRCLDGREFDFTQPNAHSKFDLKICQPAVC